MSINRNDFSDLTNYLQVTYPVMESFYSLQGEGFWSGNAAFFLRLGGCDVQCFWCDVPESWGHSHPRLAVEQILQEILLTKAERIVITGGEPSLYDLFPLTQTLKNHGLKVHLETAGNHTITGEFDWICLSPKKFSPPLPKNYLLANELKVIVLNKHDLTWAQQQAQNCIEQTLKYLQPEWATFDTMIHEMIPFIQQNPTWRLSLQIHKYLNIR